MSITNKEHKEWLLSDYEELRLVPASSHVLGDLSLMGKVNGEWFQLYLNFDEEKIE